MAPDLEEDFQVVLQAARSRMRVDDLSSELHWRSRLPVSYYAFAINSIRLPTIISGSRDFPLFDLA